MATDRGRLVLAHQPSMPANTSSYWEVSGVEPSSDTDVWITRFQHLMQLQPYVEQVVRGFAPHDKAELSTPFADLMDGMAIISNEERGPDLRALQIDLMMCLFQDFGIASRAFTAEMGLKSLLKLSGKAVPHKHFLGQLFELLPSQPKNQLDYAHRLLGRPEEFPNEIIYIPSIQEIFNLYDNIYTQIRYRAQVVAEAPMLSAWYNLACASESLSFTILSHKSNLDMRHAVLADIEVESAEGEQ